MITIFSYIFNEKLKNNRDDFLNYIMSRLKANGFRVDNLEYHTKDSKPVVLIVAVDAEDIVWVGVQPVNNYTIELGCIDEKGQHIYQVLI